MGFSDLLDGLSARLVGKTSGGVHLGAVGKHPGWDDHIEPIGLDSEPLVALREVLYILGIGGIIDAAMWEKRPEEVLPGIEHVFCWAGESDTILGHMWSSTDGKGRARYPMIAAAHLGVPFSHALAARTEPVLADVEAHCRAVTTAEEVRAIFATALGTLRGRLAQPPDGNGPGPDRATCNRLARAMGLDDTDTLCRVLYAVQSKKTTALTAKASSGKISLKMLDTESFSQQIRLPMDFHDSIGGIAFWHKVIMGFCTFKRPLLFIHPVGYPWLDLIIGTPTARELFCIRANEAALPPASAVPYELEPAFRQSVAQFMAGICDATPGTAVRQNAVASATPPPLPQL